MRNKIKEPDKELFSTGPISAPNEQYERECELCLRAVMLHKRRKYGYHLKVTWRDKLAAMLLMQRRSWDWFDWIGLDSVP